MKVSKPCLCVRGVIPQTEPRVRTKEPPRPWRLVLAVQQKGHDCEFYIKLNFFLFNYIHYSRTHFISLFLPTP